MSKLQEVTSQLEYALSGISFEKLDISDEIQEQVRGYLCELYCLFNHLLTREVMLSTYFSGL